MAEHSPRGPFILAIPQDQPVSGYSEWFREMARAINQLVDRVNNPIAHGIRVAATDALNSAVANGAALQFDIIGTDSDGYVPTTTPFDTITIPAGLGGTYILAAWSSGTGTQATSLGMGILINGSQIFSETNQSITGPASVNYTLDNSAVDMGNLDAGTTIQLINNSVSGGTNAFTAVTLSLARLG